MNSFKIFVFIWVTLQHASAVYGCPISCKCHSRDVFCVAYGNHPLPNIPWNKTIVQVRNYVIENGILTSETIDGNNITKLLLLQNLGIKDIEDGAFELFQCVEIINLNENELTQLRDGMFVGLEHLKTLEVSKNRLSKIDMTFSHFTNLLTLDFSYNNITNVSWMSELKMSRYAFNRYSRKRICVKSSPASSAPISITLSNNPLSNTNFQAEGVFNPGVRLNLVDVGLKSIPFISMAVSYLDLSHNNIVAVTPDDILKIGYESRSIKHISLNSNNLTTLAPRAFARLERMTTLYLENNVLTEIPQYLPISLFGLYLSNNMISTLEQFAFIQVINLYRLSLKNNKISTMFPCTFCGLPLLQYLSLEGNSLSSLPEEGFMGLNLLSTLSLSKNSIQRMKSGCFIGLGKIKSLDLSFIRSKIDMDGDVFDPLGSLEELLLQGSPDLANALLASSRALATLKSLRRLDISHNKLISLRNDISEFFPRLTSLDISANRWKCNRDAELIIKLVKTHRHVFRHADIICA